jgi:DNA-directed RNA polymerase specialized sigma24 family protein
MSHAETLSAEARLVQRCLDGDEAAWRALFDCYHPQVLRYVAALVGPAADREELTQEVAGRFWLALLVRGRARLRYFDPARGRLASFLFAIAAQQLLNLVRARGRRGRRWVTKPLIHRTAAEEEPVSLEALVAEFEPRLSPAEGRFYRQHLLGRPAAQPPPALSGVNARKLRQRIRAKFCAYLRGA